MTVLEQKPVFQAKDPISSLTHLIGMILSVAATPAVLVHAASFGLYQTQIISVAVFMITMTMLYGASASYHAFHISSRADRILRKLDHANIFLLIAGSYTPVCLLAMKEHGTILLAVVWLIALAGMIFKLCWITCPKWVSSLIYISMGWACAFFLPELRNTLGSGFLLLLMEGLFYTAGGVLYALRLPLFPNEKTTGFGNHELFHLFVMAGSFFHFLLVWFTLIPLA